MSTIRSMPVVVLVALSPIGPEGRGDDRARTGGEQLMVTDVFDRVINKFGLILVDWEGHLANPAIEFFLHPPDGASFPATATLNANGVRLYFELPSQVSAAGPTKSVGFSNSSPRSVVMSVFPDRDHADEQYQLTIDFEDSAQLRMSQALDVRVIDQDIERPLEYDVAIDFSEDQSGLFLGAQERAIIQQAAEDWTHFFDDMNLDTVQVGAQETWIWNFPLAWTGPPPTGHWVTNSFSYAGFLLYAYGIDTPEIRSGGEPSTCCLHTSGGSPLPLRRSGGVEIEIKGNFNTLGWFLTEDNDDWWVSGNLGNEPNDLYSIVHHEFGHALAFNSGYPNFAAGEAGEFDDPAIVEYHGSAVAVNEIFDHFTGVVDHASRRGIFGNEYFGTMPRRRWLITKLDLLLLQAVGYSLRQTSSLAPLSVPGATLPEGEVQVPYAAGLQAGGGIPFYDWIIEGGALPPGVELDRFTGVISGVPTQAGAFDFVLRVRDYDNGPGVAVDTSIVILPEEITGACCTTFGCAEVEDEDGCALLEGTFLGIETSCEQPDADEDGLIDACDSCPNDAENDIDQDDVCGNVDNCPDTFNPDQSDGNGTGIGDACDVCATNAYCDDSDACTFVRCIDALCDYAPAAYGNVAGSGGTCGPDDGVDLTDILAVLDGFASIFAEGCEGSNIDIAGTGGTCGPDGVINLTDILAVLDAFQGQSTCCAPE